MKAPKKKRLLLAVEQLEERSLPASWGVAWPNADHLRLSFVPDGTPVDGYQSTLFSALNSQATTASWQTEILRAFQTWAAGANVNVGLVGDNGVAVGGPAVIQGAAGMGDLRVSAHMLVGAVGEGTPYDLAAGSRAGDIVLDTSQSLGMGGQGTYDLYSVALHEAGHTFGLPDNNDTTSVEYHTYQGSLSALGTADVTGMRSLYGARAADQYEGSTGNDTFATASAISIPNVAADISSNSDVDIYQYTLPSSSSSTVNVTVQTGGISLMTPRISVYDSNQQLLGTAQSTNPLDGGATLQLSNLTPGASYYLRVEAARSDVFGIGSYRLKIDSGTVSATWIATLDAAYDGAAPPAGGQSHTLATATSLDQSAFEADPRFDRVVAGTIQNSSTSDFYQVAIPATSNGQPRVLVASVSATGSSTLSPRITVYDQSGNPVPADILVNGSGAFLVQVPNAASQATYSIQVSASNATTGAYFLGVDFRSSEQALTALATSTLPGAGNQESRTLSVVETQLAHLVFSVAADSTSAPTAARLLIYDQNGHLVTAVTTLVGDTGTVDVFLQQGTYQVVIAAAAQDGSTISGVNFHLSYDRLSDPLDPIPVDPSNNSPTGPTVVLSGPTVVSATDPYANPWTPLPGS